MKRTSIRAVVLTSFLIFITPVCAQEKADLVVMKNGDRLTCTIKSLAAGVLYVELDYVDGTISVDWSKVARVESSRLFIVKTEAGSSYTGTLSPVNTTGGQPVSIQITEAPNRQVEIERSKIVSVGETSNRFWKRLSGDINLGLNYAKGNQSTEYNLNSSIIYARERWNAEANYNSNFSSNTGAATTTRNQFALRFNRLSRWRNYFYTAGGSLLQSSEQGINLQTTLFGGVGHYFKNSNRAKISLAGGLGWQRTNYTARLTQNSGAAIIAGEAKIFRFKKTNLNIKAVLIPSITEPGRVRFNLNQSYYVKLFKDITWTISFYGDWDNRPPPGLSGSDYGTSSGLGWTFGYK